jgi:hypothetical protein
VCLCEFSCPPPAVGKLKSIEIVGATNALVYCDLIGPQYVGGQHARCLRTFIHESKYCDHTFQHVYYIPVEKRAFHDISIAIVDLYGKKITFKSGAVPVKVVLHFRRVQIRHDVDQFAIYNNGSACSVLQASGRTWA